MRYSSDTQCSLCGATGADFRPGKGYRGILICSRCGHVFAACEMSNSEIYDESYFEERYVDYEAALTGQSAQWRINFYRALLAVASRLARGRRLLDVGCGLGEFLEAARQAGWEAEGLDISAAACRVASERTGCPTRACELGADTYAPSSFDAVAAIDLLEHLPDPRATLGHIRTILKPDAVLVVVTPNLNGLSTRLFGAANYALDASSAGPGHVQFFSPRSLGSLLQLTGFEVVRKETRDFYLHNLVLAWHRIRSTQAQTVEARARQGRVSSAARRGIQNTRLGQCAISVVNVFLRRFGVGDQLVAIARRGGGAE